ncbi:MAG TPA: TonB-dependent receptor, partial [Vicinamibacterales bacterium]
MMRGLIALVTCLVLSAPSARAQETTGTIEGAVTDRTAGAVAGAQVTAINLDTGFTKEAASARDGFYRVLLLPVGRYTITVEAPQFATLVLEAIQVNLGQVVRVNAQLELPTLAETVTVSGGAQLVDTTTNALGRVVTGRELVDLPLNGRNFTQLGLLQTGVAPLTAGVATAGGSLRQGQAYAVNGMRPESNMYLVDGGQNVNRMDGGYALKLPVEAIAEFRILTQSAPPEYGGTGGATTSVVTRSGSNQFHGNAYEFIRNDVFDARNYFSEKVEPLKQNQFGATFGGPIAKNRLLFFGYYEGFRNKQGYTTTATVPTDLQRTGDFSDLGTPLINFAAGGVPIPGNKIPAAAINPVSLNVIDMYPHANVGTSLYRETVLIENLLDSFGGRVDFNASPNSQFFARYAYSGGHNINPVSVRGTDAPGFPTRDDLGTHLASLSSTQILSPSMTNSLRATYLRHEFYFDQRLNQTPPSALGFGYDSSNAVGQGPPFFNMAGYSPIGGAITGPRNTTQNTFEIQDSVTWANSSHLVKVGGEFRNTGIDMIQAIAPNAFYVFASTFPTNNSVANLLLGAPVVFYQGLGDFERGVRVWGAGTYAQDEWRVTDRLTLNYGLRYERINPLTEIEDRLNAFVPGVKSQVRPDAPVGLLFPGDPGVGRGIAQSAIAFMPRAG